MPATLTVPVAGCALAVTVVLDVQCERSFRRPGRSLASVCILLHNQIRAVWGGWADPGYWQPSGRYAAVGAQIRLASVVCLEVREGGDGVMLRQTENSVLLRGCRPDVLTNLIYFGSVMLCHQSISIPRPEIHIWETRWQEVCPGVFRVTANYVLSNNV